MLPSKEKLKEIVKTLAKIMRIQDWDIDVKLLTTPEMQKETGSWDNTGEAYRNMRHKYACIRLNTQGEGIDDDWYETLIHEMKHIQTTEFIYTFHEFLNNIEIPEVVKTIFKNQTTDYYEQWMNVCAREFSSIYPVTNFIKDEVETCESLA